MRLKPAEFEQALIRYKRPIQTLIEHKPNHYQLPILIFSDNNLLVYIICDHIFSSTTSKNLSIHWFK
jgi:hypothetical protein